MPRGRERYDVVVVGAGPNGLAAAIALAQRGLATLLVEASDSPGGGARSAELTVPGFLHDVCSSVHPLGVASPFFRSLGLERHGLEWIESPAPLAHVFRDGRAITMERSLEATGAALGRDGPAYVRLLRPFVEHFDELLPMVLGPPGLPPDPVLYARFGLRALPSLSTLASRWFRGEDAPALLAGIAAHAMRPLEAAATSSFALVLAMAGHAVGWPLAKGGSQAITSALVARFRALGGELALHFRVSRLDELPSARAYVFDVTPKQLVEIAGAAFPSHYRKALQRYAYGPGVFKMDFALSEPIPFRDPACARAATVHLSGTLEDVALAERTVVEGRMAPHPFVLLVQPTRFDPSRAPEGKHIAWAYCHVPHGSPVDASGAIEAVIEEVAPGFRDTILARHAMDPLALERYDENYVGGDIGGGRVDVRQLLFRPVMRPDPYATPAPNVFLCSSSTPPGGGVHGMCGYHAAQSVLRNVFERDAREGARAAFRA